MQIFEEKIVCMNMQTYTYALVRICEHGAYLSKSSRIFVFKNIEK